MITLTWKFLDNNEALRALMKLGKCDALNIHTAYRIGRINQACDQELKKARAGALEILAKHAKKDEKGAIIGIEKGQPEFETPEAKTKHDEEIEAMLTSTEFTIKTLTVNMNELAGAKLTPSELMQLGPFMDPLVEDVTDTAEKETA